MDCNFENFKIIVDRFNLKTELLSLESTEYMYPYWCYPVNSQPIGLEGCILYCFIEGYVDMVFACNPESCVDDNVYPLAETFEDFLRLIITCGSANPIEQAGWMSREKFDEHVADENNSMTEEHRETIMVLKDIFNLKSVDNPYDYVKAVQKDFDYSRIVFSDEYHEITGR